MLVWLGLGIAAFIFGFDAIPRMLGDSYLVAFLGGAGYAAVTLGPFVYWATL
jgi:hypothetical protein